jgi:uncharacterized protein
MTTQTKTLDYALEIKAAPDEEGTFEGYASPFGGPPDTYGDVVEAGAFGESLAKHRRSGTMPLMLWQHDSYEPIGVWEEFAEDGRGLWGKGKLLRGVQKADEAYIRIKAKAVRGLSIGFRMIEAEPIDQGGGGMRLKKLDLVEVSIVSFPAAQRARIGTVKEARNHDYTETQKHGFTDDLGGRFSEWARRVRDSEHPPIKEFEALLRDAGVPRSMAVAIASVGFAKAVRSESEGGEATATTAALLALRDALGSFHAR